MNRRFVCRGDRVLSFVLVVALLLALAAAAAPQALAGTDTNTVFPEGSVNLQWRYNSTTRELVISRINTADPDHHWPNTWGVGGAPWHQLRDLIRTVTVGPGITMIGQNSFNGYENLTALNVPNVISIGDFAFAGCTGLTAVNLPEVTHIGGSAFKGALNLSEVLTPEAIQVGAEAFSGCVKLQSASLLKATHIGDYAFRGCTGLSVLTLPHIMHFIGEGFLYGCNTLADIRVVTVTPNPALPVPGNLRLVENDRVLYAAGFNETTNTWEARALKSEVLGLPINLVIPAFVDGFVGGLPPSATVTEIDTGAFAYNGNIQTVIIPSTVHTVGLHAFSWCNALREATFEGRAPYVPQVPSVNDHALIFENVVSEGFTIYFNYFPTSAATGWPTPPNTFWRGYNNVLAKTHFVLIDPAAPANPSEPIVTRVQLGRTVQLSATVYPTNASQKVTWTSRNENVATVAAENGLVRGVTLGIATVVATTADGATAERIIHVVEDIVPVTDLRVDHTVMTMTMDDLLPQHLTAVVYPANASNQQLIWSNSNPHIAFIDLAGVLTNRREVIPVSPGTTTITVRTLDGSFSASSIVTVLPNPQAPGSFVPVNNISLEHNHLAMGATMDLNELASVSPDNATNKRITSWRIVSESTPGIASLIAHPTSGLTQILQANWMNTAGTVVVEATINAGLANEEFPPFSPVDYKQEFTIAIELFLPTIRIVDVPTRAFTAIPLKLEGTVQPAGASHKDITWSIVNPGGTEAYLDPVTDMLVAQKPGAVTVRATIKDGVLVTGQPTVLRNYTQDFVIQVRAYNPAELTLRADPGGTVSSGGEFAFDETVTISASPDAGYVFGGWRSSRGGTFADSTNATTEFTMPNNETTVTAFFTYVGFPGSWSGDSAGWAGGMIIPTPVHYFTSGTIYYRSSGVPFAFVALRDFHLFNHVTLDGVLLTRNTHYTATRHDGFTMVTLNNGYLDSLNQGPYTLIVHFTDHVSTSAVFTVIVSTSPAPQTYDDVFPTDWYYPGVVYSSERGWLTSRPSEPRIFRPNDPVTQGEIVDAMYTMAGNPTVPSMYGYPLQGRDAAAQWALANSIRPIGGAYNMNSPATRQDIVHLLSRMISAFNMRYPVVRDAPQFSDEWAIDTGVRAAVVSFYRAEIINGRTANTFVPAGSMSRAEFAVVLQRLSNAMGRW